MLSESTLEMRFVLGLGTEYCPPRRRKGQDLLVWYVKYRAPGLVEAHLGNDPNPVTMSNQPPSELDSRLSACSQAKHSDSGSSLPRW